jgi:hypothetical protein
MQVVVQVEETAAMGRGKSYERILIMPLAKWRIANPKGDK